MIKVKNDTVYIRVTRPKLERKCLCKEVLVTVFDARGNVYCAACGGFSGKLTKQQLEFIKADL